MKSPQFALGDQVFMPLLDEWVVIASRYPTKDGYGYGLKDLHGRWFPADADENQLQKDDEMKPITEYLSAPAVTDIATLYGDHLEHLSNVQKFELIGYLGIWVAEVLSEGDEDKEIPWEYRSIEGKPDHHVAGILSQCDSMAVDEVCVFIGAITDLVTV